MALIARIFVVLFAFLAASIVAGLVLTLGLLPPELDELTLMPGAHAGFGLAVALSAVLICGYALIPAMLFIAVAEGFRLRSFVFYAGFGAAAALLTAQIRATFLPEVASVHSSRAASQFCIARHSVSKFLW